jgi:F-box and WD-40 domain protein CDC4
MKTLSGHTSTIRALVFLNDINRIISASRDATIRVWNIAIGECTDVLTAHTGTIRTLALSRASDLLLSGGHDGKACLWRVLNNGAVLVHNLHGHEGAIYYVDFAESAGTQLLTGGADTFVRIWDPEDGCVFLTTEADKY